MEFDTESLSLGKRYHILTALIQPRPIAWVSTCGTDGSVNLAPFSFFTGITANPMTVCFAPVRDREGRKKDTLRNIEETREFVVNIAVESLGEKMVQTSARYPYGVSEFSQAGLTPAACIRVKPPRVSESPACMECVLSRIVEISEGPAGGSLVIGRVVHAHIDDALLEDRRLPHGKLRTLGRLEEDWYARQRDSFRIPDPK
ncbi:MAG: flavin reductase family protein [Elusimicrobiota bacterium]|jgi:flavin reductase (DIM6/NTAB) family NADH-FMN oxidoreductase RutF